MAIARYRRLAACGVPVMGVVKADAYGHGAVGSPVPEQMNLFG